MKGHGQIHPLFIFQVTLAFLKYIKHSDNQTDKILRRFLGSNIV